MSDTNDKELLELAAKAVGMDLAEVFYLEREGLVWVDGEGQDRRERRWNPLTDDGDALRLAVNLNLFNGTAFYKFRSLERFSGQDADDITATRRAITRAAAAIGRGTP